MTNRRVVRVLAAVCGTAVLSLPGATPAMGSSIEEKSGTSTHAAGSLLPLTGYYLAAADGGVFAFGDARFHGSMAGQRLNKPIIDIERTLGGNGYWLLSADGGVFAFGNARFYGSMAGQRLNAPAVAIARTPSGEGYWLLGKDGGIFAFGDAGPLQPPLPQRTVPVVDLYALETIDIMPKVAPPPGPAPDPDPPSKDSWAARVVNSDGAALFATQGPGVQPAFSGFGGFLGIEPPITLASDIVAVTGDGFRFWMTAADGGVFSLWDRYYGSMAGKPLNAPVVDMVASSAPGADGYVLAAADGGVFAFGNVPFLGSMAGKPLNAPVVGMS